MALVVLFFADLRGLGFLKNITYGGGSLRHIDCWFIFGDFGIVALFKMFLSLM